MARHELSRADILEHALRLARKYKNAGMTLTLRQMYYQFVANNICPSGQLHYKRIGDVLTDARYDGSYPIEWLEDRGRSVDAGDFYRHEDSVNVALNDAAGWLRNLPSFLLRRARWRGQRTHVSVWVEKQALEGVFEPVCRELGVSWFACKGYPSVSALYDWIKATNKAIEPTAQRLQYHFPGTDINWKERHAGGAERAVVLYFGDHDPDGWEIPRSAERNLATLMQVKGIDFDVSFKRVALNMNQIETYNPPPFEAKVTSARYRGYVEEHATEDAWELDALEPTVLRDLIRENVEEYFDESIYQEQQDEIEELRDRMRERMDGAWVEEALSTDNE